MRALSPHLPYRPLPATGGARLAPEFAPAVGPPLPPPLRARPRRRPYLRCPRRRRPRRPGARLYGPGCAAGAGRALLRSALSAGCAGRRSGAASAGGRQNSGGVRPAKGREVGRSAVRQGRRVRRGAGPARAYEARRGAGCQGCGARRGPARGWEGAGVRPRQGAAVWGEVRPRAGRRGGVRGPPGPTRRGAARQGREVGGVRPARVGTGRRGAACRGLTGGVECCPAGALVRGRRLRGRPGRRRFRRRSRR